MGRTENELYISANGYISFSGDQATDGTTTIIPSSAAKPDDAIFAYWTDLDLSQSGKIYVKLDSAVNSLTVTWLDAPYFYGNSNTPGQVGSSNPSCAGKTASFQVPPLLPCADATSCAVRPGLQSRGSACSPDPTVRGR
jgi:hypothetical protein